MALIWMDSFDHYGTGSTGMNNMLDGVYAELNTGPSATVSRTGAYSQPVGTGNNAVTVTELRRVFPNGDVTSGGVGLVLWLDSLPVADGKLRFQIVNASNSVHFTITLRSDGRLQIYRGELSSLLYETATPVFVAGAWQHFEFYYLLDDAAGGIECRWNGTTVANVTGVDTKGTTGGGAQFRIDRGSVVSGGFGPYIDDLFAWDTSGSFNNDFIGDRRIVTLYPNGDTANADYTITGSATGYGALDETAPNDATDYISFAAPADISDPPIGDFDVTNLDADVVAVHAVQTYVRMRKDDAGDCNVQTAFVSSGVEGAGTNRPITEEFTYWMDVFETDPNTGSPWTPTNFNAAQLRITRNL